MRSLKKVFVSVFIVFLLPGVSNAQEQTVLTDSSDFAEIKQELKESNSKLLDILNNVTTPKPKENKFKEPAIILSFIIALGGWVFGIYQAKLSANSSKILQDTKLEESRIARLEQNIFAGLNFFSGGTQRRGIGIAIVKANWPNSDLVNYRPTWRSILISQAVYLLNESKQHEKKHELANLTNIMEILIADKENIELEDAITIEGALAKNKENKSNSSKDGLKIIEDTAYNTWEGIIAEIKTEYNKQ